MKSKGFILYKGKKLTPKNVNFVIDYYKKPIIVSNKLAYLAGLIDGEGYLKVEKCGTLRLVIGMTDFDTIKWIYDTFGGRLDRPRTLKSKKKFFVWRMTDPAATLKLMLMVYPFMITKKSTIFKALGLLIEKKKLSKDFSSLDMFKNKNTKLK